MIKDDVLLWCAVFALLVISLLVAYPPKVGLSVLCEYQDASVAAGSEQ
jgi:hypothetical protein